MRTVAAVLALIMCVHAGLWVLLRSQTRAPEFNGHLASLSYTPFSSSDHPDRGARPTAEQIRADLKAIAPYTRAIRLYSSTGGAELVPPIAAEFGLKVTVGAWISKDKERNEREIAAAIDLARHNSNVDALVVGNETIYREEMTLADLIALIKDVKRSSPVPVTTGEIGSVWLQHPELASAVDFVAAHVLPYWNGIDASRAVDYSVEFYDKLRRALPGKRIVIAEFGWPSAGYNFQNAFPGRAEQAMVLRDFAGRAQAYGIDYNIVEAIDQPWKTFEGGVGSYWGIFDASRQAKFSWAGTINDADYFKHAGLAVLLGLLLSLPILGLAGATVRQALMLAISAHLAGAWFAAVIAFWKGHYFVPGAAFALGLGVLLLLPLVAIALARLDEIAAIAFGRPPRRLAASPPLVPEPFAPKVSIHIPACCELPDMLKATLDSVAQLDYPNLECVLVINNTPDAALWQPVEEHCRTLGERFKFINVENLKGYKAGALRLALANTAPDAEIVAVIDADYVVEPAWLKDLVPLFADPHVGLVQAPQDHRDGDRSLMHRAMNAEYAGFFDIGMVQRNEFNAIIVHGTMCLIRRAALDAAGGWSSETIVEDADLGLTLLEGRWTAHYTNRRYGYGLLPDTFDAYKRQRHRWAFGGFQLLRKHWRQLLPHADGLTREQKREYGIGWLNWMGGDSIGVVVALLSILWVPFVAYSSSGLAVSIAEMCRDLQAPAGQDASRLAQFLHSYPQFWDELAQCAVALAGFGAVPDRVLTLPILAAFAVSVAHFASLYRLRVRASLGEMAGAVVTAMSLQWTVARAVGTGIIAAHAPFLRTAKGGATRKGPDFPAFWEAIIGGSLLTGAVTLFFSNPKEIREINIFAVVLVVQSLPFFAATLIALVEGTRFNTLPYWRGVTAKAAVLLPQPKVIGEQPKLPSENRIETVQ